MAHYRKIDVGIWNDPAFAGMKPSGKLAFFMLLTHPNMTGIGAMRGTIAGLAIECGLSAKEFSEPFNVGLALYDESACCIFVPNFIKYQSAESINVVKAWAKQIQFVPSCNLKETAIDTLFSFLETIKPTFGLGFDEACRKIYGQELRLGLPLAYRLGLQVGKAEDLPQDNSEGMSLGKPYTVSSKQLLKPTIEDSVRVGGLTLVKTGPVLGEDGHWHEGEVANG